MDSNPINSQNFKPSTKYLPEATFKEPKHSPLAVTTQLLPSPGSNVTPKVESGKASPLLKVESNCLEQAEKPAATIEDKTTAKDWYFPEIVGVRAVAIFGVFLVHCVSFSHNVKWEISIGESQFNLFFMLNNEYLDVSIFFVLSSFVLFISVCKSQSNLQKWNWSTFYKKRFWRIVPAYYAAIVFATLFPAFAGLLIKLTVINPPFWVPSISLHLPWLPPPSIWQYATHFLFIHNFFPDTFYGINDSFWFIGPEIQFYLVFPILIWGFRRWGLKFLAIPLIICLGYRVAVSLVFNLHDANAQGILSIIGPGRWMQFVFGMVAAWLVALCKHRGIVLSASKGNLLILLFIMMIGLSYSTKSIPPNFLLYDILQGLGYSTLIVALLISRSPLRAILASRPLVAIGITSYSLFLTHEPLTYYLSIFLDLIPGTSDLILLVLLITIGFAINYGFSFLYYRCFETPIVFRKVKEYLARRYRHSSKAEFEVK